MEAEAKEGRADEVLEDRQGRPRKRVARVVYHVAHLLGVFARMLRDPNYRLPGRLKVLGIFTVLYVISPVDLLPEIIFGPIGLVDDIALLITTLKLFQEEIRTYERKRMGRRWKSGSTD